MELSRRLTILISMRQMLLILMIALLPLRGWASETMVVSMAVQQLEAVNREAPREALRVAGCPFFIQMAEESSPSAQIDSASPLVESCSSCQLCMALVTGYAPMAGIAAHSHHAKLLSSGVSFTSAEHAPRFKPPIF